MKHFKMMMAGQLVDVVSEGDLGGNKDALEKSGFYFEETKVQAPENNPMIELVCGECEYKMWLFDNGENRIEAECDICGQMHTLKLGDDGKWVVFDVLPNVPEDQVVMYDDSEVDNG